MTTTRPAEKPKPDKPEPKQARFEDVRHQPRRIPPARLQTEEEARLAAEIDKLLD